MEMWRQCATWLVECRVLPESHRATWEGAQVCELAQALRDGVLLCQLLNNLLPHSVNLKEINLRPLMSQFLCLKNIRTFLGACQEKFNLRKSELFEAFDLFDVRNFAKVLDTLSLLSRSFIAIQKGYQPFPHHGCTADDDTYSSLSDQIDDTAEEDDDLYDFVEDDDNEGDEIYEDLMRTEQVPEAKVDKRECCLQEIRQTEEKYSATLQSILLHFVKPLQKFLQPQDIESIFINMPALAQTHSSLLLELQISIQHHGAENLYQIFINYKERLLLYGRYCSLVESASKHLEKISSTREDVKMKLEECSKRANSGRFSLRDLLMVPIQRVLKYHLLLQELVKHTPDPTAKDNLRAALDAMKDLAQSVNEVKRDNDIIRQITTFQLSIDNMTQSLALFGRPKIDGELKICSTEKKSKQDRYAFLFDKAMFVCKKKSGDMFELKEIIELQNYQLRDEASGEKDNKKWSHVFLLLESFGKCGYDLFFKTKELKKKWLEQFEMALSNMCPENCNSNNHDFQMHCFEETASCNACSMLLRGIFFQGYCCSHCKMAAHKECLGRVPVCGRRTDHPVSTRKKTQRTSPNAHVNMGLPKVEVIQDYCGMPPAPAGFGQQLHLTKGDVLELKKADVDFTWWEGRNVTTGLMGWFPSKKVHPFSSRPTPKLTGFPWFAGNMDRTAAKNLLTARSDGTFLVRQKDAGEYAISIKFDPEIRHIKITSLEGLFRINERKAFKGLIEMIQFYEQNSLIECFKDLDTTLLTPYKQAEPTSPEKNPPFPGVDNQPVGMVRARYDFSARDRKELSLREGDTIKIISKKGPSGWWKGEVYGRVGLFPANYVDEDHSDYC
ncbi:proto-oncogene vav-like [Gadus chalcogrammus]|uniref:proto-oncogene vav-like n=1 Tax=Gadus chalcogrammus TaxID=1042646 RepID=UPI0024C377EC|nr:proto-oncogene vav-like [Gadus chalcogrammus]